MALTCRQAVPARRRVTILGSTGSIGCNTLDLLERRPEAYSVEALTANRNVALLAEQARRVKPRTAVIADPQKYTSLKECLDGSGVTAAAGAQALVEAARQPADWVMAAIVGAAGLAPTLAAIQRGAVIALANKECLISAGPVMVAEVKKHGATLLPVDSEHNAIFQVFDFDRVDAIDRIVLTASGGPFLRHDKAAIAKATPEQAVAHPNWKMGAKISVDSATLMNKGLEVIEAAHLFPIPHERIEVVVHPQSVVHSLVGYIDGSLLAQLGPPDMRVPIAFTLGWPDRMRAPTQRIDLADIGQLTFETPDTDRFPALSIARQALRTGAGAPTIMSAANEVAVNAFLAGRTGFLDIVRVVEGVLDRVPHLPLENLEDVADLDAQARATANEIIEQT